MVDALFVDSQYGNVGRIDRLHPLAGLRIALDPGHIGGSPWDERTGKYIVDAKGRRLSEGIMALQIALLLENDLKRLGATVLLTRRNLSPVTDADFAEYEKENKTEMFFRKADLEARAEKILGFRPDLTIILHLDESTPSEDHEVEHLKKRCNDTKAYVPGAFSKAELLDQADQELLQEVLAKPYAWEESIRLSRHITARIHQKTGVPLMEQVSSVGSHDGLASMIRIEPGVFARNLYLQRHLGGLVSSYVELLCYEDPQQLLALSTHEHSMKIDEKYYPYSQRLLDLVDAVRDGIVDYQRDEQL